MQLLPISGPSGAASAARWRSLTDLACYGTAHWPACDTCRVSAAGNAPVGCGDRWRPPGVGLWCRPRIHIPSPVAAIGDYAPWACAQRLKLHRRRGAARLNESTAPLRCLGCRAPPWAAATAPRARARKVSLSLSRRCHRVSALNWQSLIDLGCHGAACRLARGTCRV